MDDLRGDTFSYGGSGDDAEGVVDVYPRAVHGGHGGAVKLVSAVLGVEGAGGLGQFVDADGHQAAPLGGDGSIGVRAYLIYINDSIAWGGVEGETVVQGVIVGL